MWKSGIGDAESAILAEFVQENRTLTPLCLRENRIGDIGAKALAAALQHNSTLTVLDLSDNKIGEVGIGALRAAWAEHQRSSFGLVLREQRVSDI